MTGNSHRYPTQGRAVERGQVPVRRCPASLVTSYNVFRPSECGLFTATGERGLAGAAKGRALPSLRRHLLLGTAVRRSHGPRQTPVLSRRTRRHALAVHRPRLLHLYGTRRRARTTSTVSTVALPVGSKWYRYHDGLHAKSAAPIAILEPHRRQVRQDEEYRLRTRQPQVELPSAHARG